MKNSAKHILFAVGATAMLASCSENAWNDKLDGFEGGVNYNTVIDAEFTMSASDYNAVAGNADNKAKAETADAAAALKAVGTNGLFSAKVTGREYLPAFLASSSAPYFLAPEGSKVNVTYQETGETAPIIASIADAKAYTVSAADYQGAWKSDELYISAFAPMTTAAASLPAILKDAFDDAEAGQYAVVTYDEASENPIFVDLGGGPQMHAIYSEPFNESKGAFEIYNEEIPDELTYVWNWGGANYGMKASAYASGTNYASESWLISPEITLGGSEANFSFEQACNYFTDIETAKKEATVWLRVDGSDFRQLSGYDFPESLSWTFVSSGDIDLSAYCGHTIQIAFRYTSTDVKCGTWEVKNFVVSATEGEVGVNPGYWGAPRRKGAELINTPVTTTKTAVYVYNSGKWAEASGVMAMQPADYSAMGFATNKLEDAGVYLPLYLKQALPYAVAGDEMAVAYNGTKCAMLVYDGKEWAVNNDGLQTLTAQFVKKGNDWEFVKYVGKAYFNEATELILDRQYLIVAEGICAVPTATSKTYGYMYTSPVTIAGGVIEQKNEVNAFTFATTCTVDGKEYKLPDGLFFIVDSNGRYSYMSGTYTSFNLADAPAVADGAISAGYTWKAESNGDGTWTITNGNGNWIQYSISYASFGCYGSAQNNAALPSLYMLAAE